MGALVGRGRRCCGPGGAGWGRVGPGGAGGPAGGGEGVEVCAEVGATGWVGRDKVLVKRCMCACACARARMLARAHLVRPPALYYNIL